MRLKLTRDHGSKKAGETVECSKRWAQHALGAGLATLPDKKKKTEPKPEETPETEKE